MRSYLLSLVLVNAPLWADGTALFKASLTGTQALPPNSSAYTASARITIEGHALGVEIEQLGPLLTGDAFIQSATGENLLTLPWVLALKFPPYVSSEGEILDPGGVIYRRGFAVSDSQAADLLAGRLYAVIGSPQYPNGEIRGQIVPDPSPPSIYFNPEPWTAPVFRGETLRLVASARGYPAPVLQWQFSADSALWADISGATAASVVITNLEARDAGYYRLIATNIYGAAASNPSRVRYLGTPAQSFTNLVMTSRGFELRQVESRGYGIYIIYAATDIAAPFSDWAAVATNLGGTNLVIDRAATNYPRRFYRSMMLR